MYFLFIVYQHSYTNIFLFIHEYCYMSYHNYYMLKLFMVKLVPMYILNLMEININFSGKNYKFQNTIIKYSYTSNNCLMTINNHFILCFDSIIYISL